MDPVSIILALSQVAPTLIKWATGSEKAEQVATVALEAAKGITGASNLDNAVAALKMDPEMQLKFQTAMLNRDSEFEKLYIDDKKDARARDLALQSTPKGNVRANWLVGFAVLTVTGICLLIAFRPVTDEFAKNTLLVILGMYLGELKNIYAFEFGTTRSSREKTNIIEELK